MVVISPFLTPLKNEGKIKSERSSQTGFQPVFYYRKDIDHHCCTNSLKLDFLKLLSFLTLLVSRKFQRIL